MMNPGTDQAYEAARLLTRRHAKSFYFSSFSLPAAKRRHAYAVYAFCRHLDDEVDRAKDPGDARVRVARLREFVGEVFSGAGERHYGTRPWLPAFEAAVRDCAIPEGYFFDLLAGVEMDLGRVRLRTWEDLDRYCYHVAGVVGLMMTRVLGLRDAAHEREALALGTAMQLTNILRDVAEDLRMDRIYLPEEELARFELSEADLARGEVTGPWRGFMSWQIGRARAAYDIAERGIRALPDDGSRWTVWMMRLIYAAILDEIEDAEYDVFAGRLSVGLPRKLFLAAAARWRCWTER
jgi:phytoene synthase